MSRPTPLPEDAARTIPEPADGTVPKIIAGAMLISIFSGLAGVMMYYGGDGIMTQLAK